MTPYVRPFTLDDADRLRRSIGDSVRAMRRFESTPEGQVEVLGFLVRDGACSIATLARLRRVRHQSMRTTVADLEQGGLVTRAPDPSDARGVLVSVTDRGIAMIDALRLRRSTRILEAAERALEPAERAVLAQTAGVMDKLTAALRDEADRADAATD